jgi:dienelactone hydrolase
MGELMREEAQTHAREVAADDGRRAVQIVRARAAEWGVTKLGMIGFSAGAFLAADVATDPRGAALDFVAPIYGGETRGRPVPADAPPLFTCIAHDDRMLFHMVEGLYLDWSAADRPAEIHIFRRGAHGFGMVRQGLPSDRWIDLFGDWLADQGFA